MSKKVPLVIYTDKGQRVVVGEAELNSDGTFTINVDNEEIKNALMVDDMSGFSIISKGENYG